MHIIILDSISRVENIAFAVSVTVILLLTLTFAGLFYLYYRYYKRCISNKLEDEDLRKEIFKENNKYFAEFKTALRSHDENETFISLTRYREKNKKMRNRIKIVGNAILVFFYLIFLFALGSAMYARSQGELISVGGTSCLIIRSASMEEKNARNTYLYEYRLDDQISSYAMIGLKKVGKNEIFLYDIVAFRDDEGRIVVHRIVAIEEREGETFYTTRGDANRVSADYEVNLTYEKIVGKYNGFQNFALGVMIFYFQSGIGLITLSFGLILIGFYDVVDICLGRAIEKRKSAIYPLIDAELEKTFAKRKIQIRDDSETDIDPFGGYRIRGSRLGKIEFKVPPKEKSKKRKKGLRFGKIEARVPSFAEQEARKRRKKGKDEKNVFR